MNHKPYVIVAASLMFLSIAGCGQQPPKCADDGTLSLLRNLLIDRLGSREGVTDKELIDNLKFDLPHATALDEKINRYTCATTLVAGGTLKLPIGYVSQIDEHGQHFVIVDGITDDDLFQLHHAISQGIRQGREAKASHTPAAQSPTQQVGRKTPQANIAGLWQGTLEEGEDGTMVIKPGNTGFDVELSVSTPGCVGAISGSAVLTNDTLTLVNKEGGEVCVVHIDISGNRAEISENNCSYHHGKNCTFSGTLHKVR